MNLKSTVEKIVPGILTILIIALFTMYMDVAFLKTVAKDYKERADKANAQYKKDIRTCLDDNLLQDKDIEFINYRLNQWKK